MVARGGLLLVLLRPWLIWDNCADYVVEAGVRLEASNIRWQRVSGKRERKADEKCECSFIYLSDGYVRKMKQSPSLSRNDELVR